MHLVVIGFFILILLPLPNLIFAWLAVKSKSPVLCALGAAITGILINFICIHFFSTPLYLKGFGILFIILVAWYSSLIKLSNYRLIWWSVALIGFFILVFIPYSYTVTLFLDRMKNL